MVVVDLVVAAPQPLVGGHGDQQRAAGGDRATELAQGGEVVLEVLDHIQAHGQVEAVVGERHLQHRARDHLARVARAGNGDARLGELNAGHGAEPGELDHVAPAAASGVEDARGLGQPEPGDHAAEHRSPPPVPPVAVLDLVRLTLVVRCPSVSIFS